MTNDVGSIHSGRNVANADDNKTLPLILSLLAGLSTCLGAAVVFCKRPGPQHLCFSLALAGSVMVTVSVASILPESFIDEKSQTYVELGSGPFWHRCVGLAIGCGLYWLLSKCAFPEPDHVLGLEGSSLLSKSSGSGIENNNNNNNNNAPSSSASGNSQEFAMHGTPQGSRATQRKKSEIVTPPLGRSVSNESNTNPTRALAFDLETVRLLDDQADAEEKKKKKADPSMSTTASGSSMWSGADLTTPQARRAWRVALLLFVSLAVHNFPEGLAVAASTLHSPTLGVTTSVAIALHNIPEGIAIAVPCLAARPDRPWLAFGLASLSGLAEPLGALVALACLDNNSQESTDNTIWDMKNVLAFVAGIMVMVACRELFPEAMRYANECQDNTPLAWGSVVGMLVMLASDAVLEA